MREGDSGKAGDPVGDLGALYRAVRERVVGREDEAQLILAALAAGRDLLLEGPPGTSKSTILRAITGAQRTPLHFVEGNADLTPAKLLGHHSPARVMEEGYTRENFMPGPLPQAMSEGGFLYIEEFNRVPEDTLNTLITAMAEREVTIPRAGRVCAGEGFRVIAAMNPFDNIGTERLSGAVADRLCRVRMDYQTEEQEREIVARRTASENGFLVRLAVAAARASREHPDLRAGASVRAAIDFVLVAERLAELRGVRLDASGTKDAEVRWTLVAAARTAFAIKVRVRESSGRSSDEVISAIVLYLLDRTDGDGDDLSSAGDRTGRVLSGQSKEAPGERAGGRGDRPPGGVSGRAAGLVAGGGRVLSGEAAVRGASARNRGGRTFRGFARDHPGLAAKLGRRTDAQALEEALKTEPGGRLDALAELVDLYDRADLRAEARRLAAKVLLRTARRDVGRRSGRGRLTSVRYRGEAGELDLERTLEAAVGAPELELEKSLRVLERRTRRRSYALMLDVSGSMKGAAVFRAAMALASVVASVERSPGDAFAVVAFWREAALLKGLHESARPDVLLDRLFSLSGRGLTDLELGLRVGLAELEGARTQERVGLLFGDGLQTAGSPAGPVAAAFPKLHVVSTGGSEESAERCRTLAALGGGRCAFVTSTEDVPGALGRCLAAS